MKQFKIWLGVVCGTTLIALMGLGGKAWAAGTPSSITTSPVMTTLVGQPGKSVSASLQVENNGSQPVPMTVELKVFTAGDDYGRATIKTPDPSDVSVHWVHFSQTAFIAEPGVWTPITMTVDLPANAALGYYYAVLFKPVLPTDKPAPKTNTISASNVILVLVNAKSPNEKQQLKIENFKTSSGIYEYLPANFQFTVRNSGNIYSAPRGDIYISRDKSSHTVIDTIPVNAAGGNVLPGSSRIFAVHWSNGFPVFRQKTVGGQPLTDKQNRPIEQLHWEFSNLSKFRFGRYYARLALIYNDGQRDVPAYQTIAFWVIPWKLLALGLVVLLLILGGMFGFGRFVFRRVHHLTRKR